MEVVIQLEMVARITDFVGMRFDCCIAVQRVGFERNGDAHCRDEPRGDLFHPVGRAGEQTEAAKHGSDLGTAAAVLADGACSAVAAAASPCPRER